MMRPAVSILAEGLRGGWVTMMTRGWSTSSGSQTVSTFDTLWRGKRKALMLLMIATCRSINALLCNLLLCINKHGYLRGF